MNSGSAKQAPLLGLLIVLSIPIAVYAFLFRAGIAGDPEFHDRFAGLPLFAGFHVLGGGSAAGGVVGIESHPE